MARHLRHGGWQVSQEAQRGLDHGASVPLMYLLPQANVPVFQLSLPLALNARQALELGRSLAVLRSRGVAIVGSGSMTHNLYEFRGAVNQPEPYVTEFTQWVRTAVQGRDVTSLVDYRALAPET